MSIPGNKNGFNEPAGFESGENELGKVLQILQAQLPNQNFFCLLDHLEKQAHQHVESLDRCRFYKTILEIEDFQKEQMILLKSSIVVCTIEKLVTQFVSHPDSMISLYRKGICFVAIRLEGQSTGDALPVGLRDSYLAFLRAFCPFAIYKAGPYHSVSQLIDRLSSDPIPAIVVSRCDFVNPFPKKISPQTFSRGFVEREKGRDLCLITSGITLTTASSVAERCFSRDIRCGIIDLFRIKPMDEKLLYDAISPYTFIATLEVHTLVGGLGSCILETLSRYGNSHAVIGFGIDGKGNVPDVDDIMETLAWKIW